MRTSNKKQKPLKNKNRNPGVEGYSMTELKISVRTSTVDVNKPKKELVRRWVIGDHPV